MGCKTHCSLPEADAGPTGPAPPSPWRGLQGIQHRPAYSVAVLSGLLQRRAWPSSSDRPQAPRPSRPRSHICESRPGIPLRSSRPRTPPARRPTSMLGAALLRRSIQVRRLSKPCHHIRESRPRIFRHTNRPHTPPAQPVKEMGPSRPPAGTQMPPHSSKRYFWTMNPILNTDYVGYCRALSGA